MFLNGNPPNKKTHPYSILQVPTTQLAKMSFDPKFVELTADVLKVFFIIYIIIVYIYIFFKQKNRTPPIKKKLTHSVYYKYQQRSLQR